MYQRMFVIMAVNLYASRVVLKELGVEDYGLYNVIGGIIAMFLFLNGTMTNTTSRFITVSLAKGDMQNLNQIFNMAVIIHLILAIIILIIGETVGIWYLNYKLVVPEGRMFAAQWLYQLTIISAVFNILYVPYNATIVAHERMGAFAYISIMDAALKLSIVLLLAYSPFDKLIFYGTLLTLVSIIDLLIYFSYCKKHFIETKLKFYWDKIVFKKMLSFAGWGSIGNFSYVFYSQGINLMLNFFCGPAVNAARGIAVQVESVIRQFANNVQVAINPQIMKTYANKEMERMYELIFASSRFCFYLLYFIALPLLIEIEFVLGLWLGKESIPDHTVNFVRIILLTSILDAFINPMFTANLASGKLKIYQICVCTVSYFFMFITYFTLEQTHKPESVFLCLLISTLIGIVARIFVLYKQINLDPHQYLSKVIKPVLTVIVASLCLPILVHLSMNIGWIRFLLTGTVSVITVILSVYYLGLGKKERDFIIEKLHTYLHCKNHND